MDYDEKVFLCFEKKKKEKRNGKIKIERKVHSGKEKKRKKKLINHKKENLRLFLGMDYDEKVFLYFSCAKHKKKKKKKGKEIKENKGKEKIANINKK